MFAFREFFVEIIGKSFIPNADIGSGSKKGILQQYSTFCSSLERDVKNYYFLLYEEYKHDTF